MSFYILKIIFFDDFNRPAKASADCSRLNEFSQVPTQNTLFIVLIDRMAEGDIGYLEVIMSKNYALFARFGPVIGAGKAEK